MPSNVVMPKTGADANEAKLIRWLKKDGDAVSRGDILAEIETDKVNMEVEAFNEGTLQTIVAEGTIAEIGTPIAYLLKPGEAPVSTGAAPAPAAATATQAAPAPAQAPAASEAPLDRPSSQTPGPAAATAVSPPDAAAPPAPVASVAATAPAAAVSNGNGTTAGDGRIKASPLARRMAQEHNLDLSQINGRGPGGRVVKEDVQVAIQNAVAASPAESVAPTAATAPAPATEPAPAAATAPSAMPAGATVKELSRIQLTTGRRLAESKQMAPHFYLTVEVNMAEALAVRATLNQQAGGGVKISVNDLVIKAATWALGRHPNLNASFRDGKLLVFDRVNIAVAVAIESGLVSPVLPDADRKSLGQIARESRAMIERARNGKLRPEDLSEGTFTVSNLGMFDIDNFIAIINPPQAAILAVGAIRQVPVVRDGAIVVGQIMKASLSCDHRAADGAQGAQFLTDVRRALETPLLMAL